MRFRQMDYTGWGRVLHASGEVARPERSRALAALAAEGPAMGNRRSYGDAPLNGGGRITDMTRMNRILGFDPETGVLHAEAGVTLGELAEIFAPRGWLPPVMPGTGFATVGGAIAMDVHGKNHQHAGSFGAHVTELELLGPTGARTVTPADLPLFRATLGGLGQTGIVASAKIAMQRCKGDVMVMTERRAPDWDGHLALLDGSDAPYVVGWIDATATGAALGRGIVEEGETASGLVARPRAARRVPFDAPGAALSPPVVRAFNRAYYARVPKAGRTSVRPIEKLFFPLDKIHDWNRLYGRRGFHQFQCVVPLAAADALRAMLERVATSGLASPLAVLKRMGPGRAGFLSFPMEGYTLAVDFPDRAAARALVGELEAMTEAAGGRIYLAKDSLASGARVRAMYPELDAWRAAVAEADPDGLYLTDLVRRLGLREAA
ncbi:putative oxidoreductase [Oceanicola granulosus HTCC2516]|uniref:Putative oxidoreductase n=1 Tax=Oceanicola granulosus (strain ATCC BAA-861 / DSM 15982 / KCTC 12143 / HTCC2516) TaxID=314256 RepID=Q2CIF2_OCEGH|nr:FAD-binding oxidoreductase [Oceanicola granulosus]EAR52306.1 putative oxidoreductase [Oceanicola granulosus HTCC2516]